MLVFNISSYIKILMTGLSSYKNAQGPLGILLLESIGQREDVQVIFNDKKISNLVNRKTEVDEAIIIASTKPNVISDTVDYFREKIVPDLNPHTKSDMFKAILKCINSDANTSISKYDELATLNGDKEEDKFLCYSFLYAINRTNKLVDSAPVTDDFPLIDEVGNQCPLCQEKLTRIVKNVVKRKYCIVKIFPDSLTEEEDKEFRAAKEPAIKSDSFDNMIALCTDDADSYITEPSLDEYVHLSELKKKYSEQYLLQQALTKMNLETDIKDVIDALSLYQPSGDIVDFNMEALKIDRKIPVEEILLRNFIQFNVLTYYSYIKSLFAELERFEFLQSDIKKAFKKLDASDWSHPEIVEKLAQWILNKTKKPTDHIEACRIIVSFFVQNCEVFYEIS